MDRLNVCTLVAKDHFITTADLQTLIDTIHTVDVAEVLSTKIVVRSFWSRIVDSENKHKFMQRNLTARQVGPAAGSCDDTTHALLSDYPTTSHPNSNHGPSRCSKSRTRSGWRSSASFRSTLRAIGS